MPKKNVKKTYRTISLQEDLIEKVSQYIQTEAGYNSVADFISDAIRRRLDELEKIQLVGEEYNLSEEEIKRMANLEHTNIAVNGGKTIIAIKDHTDGRIYDVVLSRGHRHIHLFCMGDQSFDCVHVKYVYHIILPRLKEYIEMYRKKQEK